MPSQEKVNKGTGKYIVQSGSVRRGPGAPTQPVQDVQMGTGEESQEADMMLEGVIVPAINNVGCIYFHVNL